MIATWVESASNCLPHAITTAAGPLPPALPPIRPACSGEPAVTLAAALPHAQVVSTDIAAPFQELGRARAAKAGLGNVCFESADAEDLHKYADASFDAVTCSLGLM